RQVLINLIGNAVKFTATGSVRVRVSRAAAAGAVAHESGGSTPAAVRFEVEDSGIGMSPQTVAGLFRSFMQADSSMSRAYGGTGLGLAISQALVTLMGGRIEVASEPGRGSRFSFEIPLPEPDARAVAQRP